VGLFDRLTPRYTPAPVNVEGAIGRWTAARTASGLPIAGGEIILTRQHLVFTPWDMTQTRGFLVKLLCAGGVRHLDIGILAGLRYPDKSSANDAAFDDWASKLRAQHASLQR
jgi:hypothetical protein